MEPVRGEGSGRGHSDGMWALGRVDVAEMKLDRQAWGRPEGEGRRRGYGGLGLAHCLIAPTEGAHESNGEGTICRSACAADALDSSSRRMRVVTLGRRRRWWYSVGAGGSVGGGREGSVGTVEGVFVCPIVSRCHWVPGTFALKQADGGQPCSRCDADTCWHSPAFALQHPERSPAGTGECVLAGVLACCHLRRGGIAFRFTVAPRPIPSYPIPSHPAERALRVMCRHSPAVAPDHSIPLDSVHLCNTRSHCTRA
jgi:hypothetical protein